MNLDVPEAKNPDVSDRERQKRPSAKFDTFEVQPKKSNYGNPSMARFNPDFSRLDASVLNVSTHVLVDPDDLELQDQNSDKQSLVSSRSSNKPGSKNAQQKFGTFDGVLGRCLLCMFGVILFLRMGWIVGHSGVIQSTVIILLSASITLLTSLSLSALSTNGDISHGGPYFLVSRTLGAEWGGVIGVLFSFGNALGVALHLLGFAEAIVALFSDFLITEHWDTVLVSELSLLFLVAVAWNGVGWIIKMNLGLLFLMTISILVFMIGTFSSSPDVESKGFTGYSSSTLSDNMGADYRDGTSFLLLLAIFFPSVTGCMAGANISGDLKKPERNIPVGTLGAVVISTVVYLIIVWMLGASCLRTSGDGEGGLYNDYLIMSTVSMWSPLVTMGIFASTFSSATSCFVAAPRILKAVCDDGLLPRLRWFGVGRESDGEPIHAYMLVTVLVLLLMLTGSINFVAPMVTNFFMVTYAMINYCVFAWAQSKSPGWRPTFKFYHPHVSLVACAQCLILMVLISWYMAVGTGILAFALYRYISGLKTEKHWGDVSSALRFKTTCKFALASQRYRPHAKVERPVFLVFNTNEAEMCELVHLAKDMNYGGGLIMIGHVLLGDISDAATANRFMELKRSKNVVPAHLLEHCLVEMCVAERFEDGAKSLLQLSGIGGIRPNVVMVKCSDVLTSRVEDRPEPKPVWFENVKTALTIGCGVVLVPSHVALMELGPSATASDDDEKADIADETEAKTIDVWWLYDDGGLTVLMAYLLTLCERWKACKLRVMALENLGMKDQNCLAHLMTKLRIDCEIVTVCKEEDADLFANRSVKIGGVDYKLSEFARAKIEAYQGIGGLIKRYSAGAQLCIVTLPFPRLDYRWWEYQKIIQELTPADAPIIFVRGNQEQILCYQF